MYTSYIMTLNRYRFSYELAHMQSTYQKDVVSAGPRIKIYKQWIGVQDLLHV